MRIWIVNPYGNLPGEGWSPYRSTFLAEALAQNGHDVTWWVSNFEHRSKKIRAKVEGDITISEGFKLRIIPSTPYAGNISIDRIRYERNFMQSVLHRICTEGDRADIVVLGEPALFNSDISKHIAPAAGAKLIIDVIDLWPELLAIALPPPMRRWQRQLLAPLYWRRAAFLRKADGFLAASRDYLALAQRCAPGRPGEVVYWGLELDTFQTARSVLASPQPVGLPVKRAGEIWAIFAGTLGENYDLPTILRCAQNIQRLGHPIRILLAGDGPLRSLVEGTIRENNLHSAIYLGRLEVNILRQLYEQCDIALSSYVANSTVSMPIKAYDYFAAGLPLVNSLGRDLGDFVRLHRLGLQYEPQNAESLLTALVSLANNPELRQIARTNALALASTFDCKLQYPKATQLIEKVGSERC
jgi:glycosyltransferase involved in cell wall biosynthesis